jgi:hypothetical protein
MGRLEKLERRRLDETLLVRASMANEVYARIKESESVRYTVGAMQPIDPEYTKNTFAQGDRVKDQLKQRLEVECDFEYQGSVTTDTHIKARSDIDLLVIRRGWWWLEPPQISQNPYTGDTKADMHALRTDAEASLSAAFPQAAVDSSGSSSLKLSGGSLTREVDVVPATWFDTNEYARTGDRVHRGVKVFNTKTGEFVANTPFLHGRRIEEHDQRTLGGLRRAIRLMKSLRYDSDGRVEMSSYNVTGIAYNIPEHELISHRPRELVILEACCTFCERLDLDATLRDSIRVPDGHRTVFGGTQGTSQGELRALRTELDQLRRDVLAENVRSFKRLAEARVEYPEVLAIR